MSKYTIKKHKGNRITVTTEGIDISYGTDDKPVVLGEIDLSENSLDKIKVKVKENSFKVNNV